MDRNRLLDISLVLGLLLVLVIAAIALVIIKSEGSQCIVDPIKYGANKIASNEDQDVSVTISSFGKNPVIYTTELYQHD